MEIDSIAVGPVGGELGLLEDCRDAGVEECLLRMRQL